VFFTVDNLLLFILQHTAMHKLKIIYFTKLLSYFSIVHKHIDTFVLSCRDFNDSSAKEIRVLHTQLFTNSSFHFLVIVECAQVGQTHHCARRLFWKNDETQL